MYVYIYIYIYIYIPLSLYIYIYIERGREIHSYFFSYRLRGGGSPGAASRRAVATTCQVSIIHVYISITDYFYISIANYLYVSIFIYIVL